MKRFTSVAPLDASELLALVERGVEMRRRLELHEPAGHELAGRTVANLFFEPSTRTRLSFDLAAQRLGANVITLDSEVSSTTKGESLRDTVLTVTAIGADILVVRHREEGAADQVAEWSGRPVVNAGDGTNEHPTQALLDVMTIHRKFQDLRGLSMAIVGDIAHSRVANSLMAAMSTLEVDLTLVGPSEWVPPETSFTVTHDLDEVLPMVDILYLLRVQTERGSVVDDRYIERYGVGRERATRLREGAVVMHPGPINRGVEISDEVADSPRSLILEQVANGVPARMAVLEALGAGT